jgi:hypothetical protein
VTKFRFRTRIALPAAIAGFVLCSAPALARRGGIQASSCSGCHGGAVEAELNVTIEPEQIEVGETVSLLITVGGEGTSAAGVSIFGPEGGAFTVEAGQPLTVFDRYVTHSAPKPAASGQVEFRVDWKAPQTVGLGTFEVAVLAANGDGRASGDRSSGQYVYVAYGCTPKTVYWDFDKDGVGREDSPLFTCDDPEGYAPTFGDCDDRSPDAYPGAPELCNEKDDDCDGEIDEHVVDIMFYADADGDGYGDSRNVIEACVQPEGFVTNGDDCHDGTVDASPVAPEICDYIDNDCDGQIDEGVRQLCGVGLCVREAALCGETTECTPGDPLEERCNGYDDDCDGEIDEEGCPAGQQCFDNACVARGSTPSVSPTTTGGATQPVGPDETEPTSAPNTTSVMPMIDEADDTITPTGDEAAPSATIEPDESDAPDEPSGETKGSAGGCHIDSTSASKNSPAWWSVAALLGLVSLTTRRCRKSSP